MKYTFSVSGFITVEADNPDDAFDLATELLCSSEDTVHNECESISLEAFELYEEFDND